MNLRVTPLAVAALALSLALPGCATMAEMFGAEPQNGEFLIDPPKGKPVAPVLPFDQRPSVVDAEGQSAVVVQAQLGVQDAHPRAFATYAGAGDSAALTVFFWSGPEPCNVVDHVRLIETDQEVTVTIFEGFQTDDGQEVACDANAVYKAVVIELDAILGDRVVLDGALAT